MIETILFYDQQLLWESEIKTGNPINPFAQKQFSQRQKAILGLQNKPKNYKLQDYEWGWKEYKVREYEY